MEERDSGREMINRSCFDSMESRDDAEEVDEVSYL
jgi:hypothetical protein